MSDLCASVHLWKNSQAVGNLHTIMINILCLCKNSQAVGNLNTILIDILCLCKKFPGSWDP